MAQLTSVHPRTTAERAQCGDFVLRLLESDVLPKTLVPRITIEVAPVLEAFDAARSANVVASVRATLAGGSFRAASTALRSALESWMRSIDDAHDEGGYAEAHLRAHFGNRSLSRLFLRGAHVRLELLRDLLDVAGDDSTLCGAPDRLAKARAAHAAFAAAVNAYDGAREDRALTVNALKAAAAAFDVEYDNLAARLLQTEQTARIVPRFVRRRGAKVADAELADAPAEPDDDGIPTEASTPALAEAEPAVAVETLARECGQGHTVAGTLAQLAELALDLGDPDRAEPPLIDARGTAAEREQVARVSARVAGARS